MAAPNARAPVGGGGDDTPTASLEGTPFAKLTGSGNDFVFFDAREVDTGLLATPEVITSICNRNNGIGADGIVILEDARPLADARILYFNSDGTPADLCGNATLCSTRMAVELGLASADGMQLATPAGLIRSSMRDGAPQIELPLVREVRPKMPIDLSTASAGSGSPSRGFRIW